MKGVFIFNPKRPYNSQIWKTLRIKQLVKQPYCNNCGTNINLHVDHIIEHNNNSALFLDPKNLQTLCVGCHGEKTRQYQLKNNKPKKVKPKKTDNFYKFVSHLKINEEFKITILLNQKDGVNIEKNHNASSILSKTYFWINNHIYLKIANKTITKETECTIKDALIKIFMAKRFYTFNISIKPKQSNLDFTTFIKQITQKEN